MAGRPHRRSPVSGRSGGRISIGRRRVEAIRPDGLCAGGRHQAGRRARRPDRRHRRRSRLLKPSGRQDDLRMTEANAPEGSPQPKSGVLDIAPYVGGKSAIAGVAKPIKLSSNENALGAGEKAREAFAAAVASIHLYPDGRADRLRAAVAEEHGLEPERLIFGNGSDEVFALLNQTYL